MLQARGVSVFVGGCSAVRNNNVNVRSNLSHWTVSVVKSYSAQVHGNLVADTIRDTWGSSATCDTSHGYF